MKAILCKFVGHYWDYSFNDFQWDHRWCQICGVRPKHSEEAHKWSWVWIKIRELRIWYYNKFDYKFPDVPLWHMTKAELITDGRVVTDLAEHYPICQTFKRHNCHEIRRKAGNGLQYENIR